MIDLSASHYHLLIASFHKDDPSEIDPQGVGEKVHYVERKSRILQNGLSVRRSTWRQVELYFSLWMSLSFVARISWSSSFPLLHSPAEFISSLSLFSTSRLIFVWFSVYLLCNSLSLFSHYFSICLFPSPSLECLLKWVLAVASVYTSLTPCSSHPVRDVFFSCSPDAAVDFPASDLLFPDSSCQTISVCRRVRILCDILFSCIPGESGSRERLKIESQWMEIKIYLLLLLLKLTFSSTSLMSASPWLWERIKEGKKRRTRVQEAYRSQAGTSSSTCAECRPSGIDRSPNKHTYTTKNIHTHTDT